MQGNVTFYPSFIRPRWSHVANWMLTTKFTRSNTAWKDLTTSILSLLNTILGTRVDMGDTILLRPLSSIALVLEPSILSTTMHRPALTISLPVVSISKLGSDSSQSSLPGLLVEPGTWFSWAADQHCGPWLFPQLNVADERAFALANHFHPQYTLHSVLWGIIAHS